MEYQLINSVDPTKSIIQQVLNNRGIKDVLHYLNTTDDDLNNPTLLANIEQAAHTLLRHCQNGKIYVQIDEDADGYTSGAILLNYLHRIIPSIVDCNFNYGLRDLKLHGIDMDNIPADTTLVIVPDAGSSELEKCEQLQQRGIEVIILDHHMSDVINTSAIVVNNQLCDYPNKTLSGAGIVYKFCKYLDSILELNIADDFIDLTMLGIIADVMSLQNYETVQIIRTGIKNIKNPFIKTMVQKNAYSLGDEVTPDGVAFYIAPYINAVTRIGTLEERILLFNSMLEWKADDLVPSTKRGCVGQTERLVEQAVRTCNNIKNHQKKLKDENTFSIEQTILEQDLLKDKILIVQIPKEKSIHKGLTGLIANELANKYQRPTFILNETEENGKKVWSGSARNCENSKVQNLRQECLDSNLFTLAQGHASAFGAAFLDENAEAVRRYFNKHFASIDFTPYYFVDFEKNANNFDPDIILTISEYKYLWGTEVKEPKIAIKNINVTKNNIVLMSKDKNPTIKITLPNGIALLKFKSNEEEFENLFSKSGCVVIDVVGTCAINEWNGKITPQIFIENYNIIKRQEYFF